MINLGRYPIHQRTSDAYLGLVADARASFNADGYCRLLDFIAPEFLRKMQSECRTLALRRAEQRDRSANCYYASPEPREGPDHPRNVLFRREFGVVRDDMIPPTALLRRVYDSPDLLSLVADVVGASELYWSRDPYQALTVNCMREGEHLHWHFDCNDFAITLGIQEPLSGGELEFVRDVGRHNVSGIRQVIGRAQEHRPAASQATRLETREGSLILFGGGESIHRVLPVRGSRQRLVAAMQFHRSADAFDDPATSHRIYGIDLRDHRGPKPRRGVSH